MRTYGRVPVLVNGVQPINPETGQPLTEWVQVDTTAAGFNDYVYITTLIQTLKLNLGESPFYGNAGIPSKASIIAQVAPDYYVMQIQQQFAVHFANLTIARIPALEGETRDTPTYQVAITTNEGLKVNATISLAA